MFWWFKISLSNHKIWKAAEYQGFGLKRSLNEGTWLMILICGKRRVLSSSSACHSKTPLENSVIFHSLNKAVCLQRVFLPAGYRQRKPKRRKAFPFAISIPQESCCRFLQHFVDSGHWVSFKAGCWNGLQAFEVVPWDVWCIQLMWISCLSLEFWVMACSWI